LFSNSTACDDGGDVDVKASTTELVTIIVFANLENILKTNKLQIIYI